MQFLYFIPQGGTIKSAGLETVLDDPKLITSCGTYSGPDKKGGTIYTMGEAKNCKYKADEQVWQKSNNGLYWLGFYKDSPPSEKELARPIQIDGHRVTFHHREHEENWLIPLARIFPAGTRLPQSLILGANGEVVTKLLPQFVQFSARAEKLWKDFEIQIGLASGKQTLTDAEGMLMAAEALGFNYRINIDGINALGLFTTQNFTKVLFSIVDAPTVEARLKAFVEQDEKKKELTDVQQPEDSGQKEN